MGFPSVQNKKQSKQDLRRWSLQLRGIIPKIKSVLCHQLSLAHFSWHSHLTLWPPQPEHWEDRHLPNSHHLAWISGQQSLSFREHPVPLRTLPAAWATTSMCSLMICGWFCTRSSTSEGQKRLKEEQGYLGARLVIRHKVTNSKCWKLCSTVTMGTCVGKDQETSCLLLQTAGICPLTPGPRKTHPKRCKQPPGLGRYCRCYKVYLWEKLLQFGSTNSPSQDYPSQVLDILTPWKQSSNLFPLALGPCLFLLLAKSMVFGGFELFFFFWF